MIKFKSRRIRYLGDVLDSKILHSFRTISILEKSKDRVESIIDSIPIVISVIDLEGNIYRGNKLLLDILDVDEESLYRTDFFSIIAKEFRDDFCIALCESNRRKKFQTQLCLNSPSLNIPYEFLWEVSFYEKFNDKDLFLIVGSDVTSLEKEKVALKELNENLEEIIENRTEQLEVVYKDMIKSAHSSGKSEVVNNILHLMGNSIGAILNQLMVVEMKTKDRTMGKEIIKDLTECVDQEKLQESKIVEKVKFLLEEKKMATKKAISGLRDRVNFLNGLLEVQRIDEGGELFTEEIPLWNLLEGVIKESGLESDEKIDVSVTCDTSYVERANEGKLKYVISEILTNAKESFSWDEESEKVIQIKVDQEKRRISITDNGEGISEDLKLKVFNCGFSTKGKSRLGLGLHQSYNFMREQGGDLKVESKKGLGTVVHISFSRVTS